MIDDSLPPFDLPAVCRKKVSAAFDVGLITSDGGLVLLRDAERRLSLAKTLVGCIRDRRNQALVVHTLAAMLRFRMFSISCGYEDADDCDALRADPPVQAGLRPSTGKWPRPLFATDHEPTGECALLHRGARMTAALVDIFCHSFPAVDTR